MDTNIKWTHLPPDDVENLIRHMKANGYIDRWNTTRVDFDDLCNLMRSFVKLSRQRDQCKCGAMTEGKSN